MRSSPTHRIIHASSRLLAVAMLAAIATACSSGGTDAADAGAVEPTAASPSDTAPPSATLVASPESKAQQAVAENRIFAPEGENAIEYYLAQRERVARGDASADAALIELQPYAMIAAEQAVGTGDLVEAERLVALIARIDAAAPSLARLRGDIEAARQAQLEADAEDAAEAAEAANVASAAATAARAAITNAQRVTQTAAPTPPAATPPPARRTLPTATAAPNVAATREPASEPTNRASPSTTTAAAVRPSPAAAPTPLVAVSTPFPRFPSEAIARGRSVGSVTVRFTVRANGRVGDVQVITARPEGLFERTVVETLGEWRFEPTDRDQVQTRTFDFRN